MQKNELKMILVKLMVLTIGFVASQCKTTHADLLTALENNRNASIASNIENKTVIELNKDITVNTGLNLDKALAQLNGTEASFIPKIRKVTPVDNDSLEVKQTVTSDGNSTVANVTTAITNATAKPPKQVTKIATEGGGVVLGSDTKEVHHKNNTEKAASEDKPNITNGISKISGKEDVNTEQSDKNNKTVKITTTTNAPNRSTTTTPLTSVPVRDNNTTKALNATAAASIVAKINNTTTLKIPNTNASSTSTTTTTTMATTTTITTTTTTTTTTTQKPKKPTITYSIPDFPDLEKDNPELNSLLQSSASSDGPYAQPSQEYTSGAFQRGRDFILPIVSMIFIIPLVIGIMITSYRRFRDCWSTRHYRRMDFLVDGMYND